MCCVKPCATAYVGQARSICQHCSKRLYNFLRTQISLQVRREAIAVAGFTSEMLTLEVTELATMANPDAAIPALETLPAMASVFRLTTMALASQR